MLNPNTIFLPVVNHGENSWPMLGANPQRTSWTPEQVDGRLQPLWYKQFEPYIPPDVQIIAAYKTLYISTAAGLYALDADSGAEKWVYPTQLPLGHSPTIAKGVAYVGGHDRRLHAINAFTGQSLWTFTAEGGFSTNPLVVDGMIYIGGRDGYFHAVHAEGGKTGQLAWKYKTGGSIDFSAAYKDGLVYFASNDSHAYALNAQTGSLVWKSDKLPGAGFQSWWPVAYRDWVIFAGSHHYRAVIDPGIKMLFTARELRDVFPNYSIDRRGSPVGPVSVQSGDWAEKTCAIDTSKPNTVNLDGQPTITIPISEYFEQKPWRRTYFVLDASTGKEYTSDFDQDGKPEYAPVLWQGTHSGNRYPPVVGSDGVIYQANNYMSSPYIAGGEISGWQIGSPYISIISADWKAVDEPLAYSAGGDLIYWNHTVDRGAGSIDISIPNPFFPLHLDEPPGYCSDVNTNTNREKTYFKYNLSNLIPGYNSRYFPVPDVTGWSVYGGQQGIYGPHGDQNPPIPYRGKVYMHRSNAVIAFNENSNPPIVLPVAKTVEKADPAIPSHTIGQVEAILAEEVQKVIAAGHLRPGYHSSGLLNYDGSYHCGYRYGYNLGDYWHNPAETFYFLLRALPHLPPATQSDLKAYLVDEFAAYPPYSVTHIGWKDGAAREIFDLPPEVEAERANYPPMFGDLDFSGWFYNPFGFYAMAKYADVFGGAKNIFDSSKHLLEEAPPDEYLKLHPEVHNAFIAGYQGYLELENLARYPESSHIRQELYRLLSLRASTFSKEGWEINPEKPKSYCRGMNIARNFLYLTPELGQYLHDHALAKVQAAVAEYEQVAPYWFVASFGSTFGEGTTSSLYDYHGLFQAKALILKQPRADLSIYLDVPAVAVGDIYYLDNLIAIIEARNP
jgi:hypothetical protein